MESRNFATYLKGAKVKLIYRKNTFKKDKKGSYNIFDFLQNFCLCDWPWCDTLEKVILKGSRVSQFFIQSKLSFKQQVFKLFFKT